MTMMRRREESLTIGLKPFPLIPAKAEIQEEHD